MSSSTHHIFYGVCNSISVFGMFDTLHGVGQLSSIVFNTISHMKFQISKYMWQKDIESFYLQRMVVLSVSLVAKQGHSRPFMTPLGQSRQFGQIGARHELFLELNNK